jgi:hypothetical protein
VLGGIRFDLERATDLSLGLGQIPSPQVNQREARVTRGLAGGQPY